MDAPHHMAAVMELDLKTIHPNSLVDRINAMPALKTSAAFFTFLRANLAIPLSEMSSNVSTPLLEPTVQETTSSSATAASRRAPVSLDDIPPLSLGVLTTRADKVDALQLVADSIAQQRQTASRSLVFHPLNLAGLALALGLAYQTDPSRDVGLLLTLASGVVMSYLVLIRYVTTPYLRQAEELTWEWLQVGEDGHDQQLQEDTVIGARFGDEMIGALVLRLEGPPTASTSAASSAAAGASGSSSSSISPSSSRRKHARGGSGGSGGSGSLRGGRGVIRAWTTKLRFRRRGVGSDLLNEAVRVTRERCGKDAAIGFAQAHANSAVVLPEMYNGAFRTSERKATQALDRVLAEWDGKRKR